jgi:hypothetical protein
MSQNTAIKKQAYSRPNTGSKTVGATVVALSTSTRPLTNGVQIVAAADNSGSIYVGSHPTITPGTSDGTDGFQLAAGASVLYPAFTEAEVYLVGSAADQVISFLAY